MTVTLRTYQDGALHSVRGEIRAGNRRVLLVAPTGAGKTTIAGAIIDGVKSKGKRAIFLAHRTELIEQCSGRLEEFGLEHGVIQADHWRTNPDHNVQVASIQTLVRREHFDADLVIVDEAHRSTSVTYGKILERYDNPVVLGLTATPYRMDGKGLGDLYDVIVEVSQTQALIDEGYLVMPTVFGSKRIDLSGVSVTAGDYDRKELQEAMQNTILHGDLLKNWMVHCGKATGAGDPSECDACTVCFAPSVEQSKAIVEQFQKAGVPSAHIDAKTPSKERAEVLKRLRNRDLVLVSNVGLLTEGWDLPHLECVILARPTRSRSLFKQMVGRLMRPDDDKRFAYLLDHANGTRTHGFVNETETYSLKGREDRPRKGDAEAPLKECKVCKALCPIQAPQCEECGFVFPKREVEYTDEELTELRPGEFKVDPPKNEIPRDTRQEGFEQFCKQCVERGLKPNWARVRYMHTYRDWPSWKDGIRTPKFFHKYEKAYKLKTAPARTRKSA